VKVAYEYRSYGIKMADLKDMLVGLHLSGIQTYIQSGNVIFESNEDESLLRGRIEKAIQERFGFSTTAVIRSAEELQKLISDLPFSPDAIKKAESSSPVEVLYVALLAYAPSPGAQKNLDPYKCKEEDYRIVGRDVFLLLPHGIRQSKIVSNLERLGVPATVRNWKTLRKLDEMARANA
jgi:uncharacterized protein (DUF1697 family)